MPVADTGLLTALGARVRDARQMAGMSRRALAERSGVSERYLARLETGDGNISIGLLDRVAGALERPVYSFLLEPECAVLTRKLEHASPETRAKVRDVLAPELEAMKVALIGLRGAGKSSLGRRAAAELGWSFRELNDDIEAQSGLDVAEVFALYGPEGYRRLEQEAVERVAASPGPLILAVAGGIVAAPATFDILRTRFHTVWLKARPEEHMARVRAQGDERPMTGNPEAMASLREILASREALYARADAVVDTSGKTEEVAANALSACIRKQHQARH